MANKNIRRNSKPPIQYTRTETIQDQDIDLYHLLKFYANKWKWIVLLMAIGAVAGFVYSNYIQTPLYKSDATLILISPVDKAVTQDVNLINNYVELFKSRRVLEPVIKKQKLDMSYNDLVDSIETTNSKNTEVIKVSIATKNPKTSKSLVEGAVASFKDQISKLYNLDNVSVVDNANLSTDPYNIHVATSTAISAAVGSVASIIVLFFVYDINQNKHDSKKKVTKNKKKTSKQKKTTKTTVKKSSAKKPAKKHKNATASVGAKKTAPKKADNQITTDK